MRNGLAFLLNSAPDLQICGEAASFSEAMERIPQASPDLVLIDISLKGSSGIDLTKAMRERWPDVLALVLSGYPEETYARQALRAGARGFLVKDKAAEELIPAIRKVLRGAQYWRDEIQQELQD